jgi:UDP-N-acetylmuramyl pentapeptide phosphotransferase/UDP-N-acetylglucosamine-1-phosphate transferase
MSDFKLDYRIQSLIFTSLVLFFVGLYDDIMIISADRKLRGELLAVAAMVFVGNIRLTNLHGFFGVEELPYIPSVVLTSFVMVVIINAINLIDGIDGLASGIGMIGLLFFGTYFSLTGDKELSMIAYCMSGSLVPFFIYNVFANRRKVFMGDVGALVLGVILATLTIAFNEANIDASLPCHIENVPVVSICVLILPVFDTARVFTIRIIRKRSPFTPDKNHLHHMFLALGCSHKQSTGILLMINAIYIVVGLLLQHISGFLFFTIIFVSCLLWSEILRISVSRREKSKNTI